jgi:hypothetical protein
VFWSWTLAFFASELHEAFEYDSPSAYLSAQGNTMDAIILAMFLASMLCRATVELTQSEAREGGYSWTRMEQMDLLLGLLCMNIVFCCGRFLLMLSIVKRENPHHVEHYSARSAWQSFTPFAASGVGVMIIIMREIIMRDIMPFVCFATVVIAMFECASYYFFWILDVRYLPGSYFNMFTELGKVEEIEVSSMSILVRRLPELLWGGSVARGLLTKPDVDNAFVHTRRV